MLTEDLNHFGIISKYKHALPVTANERLISLEEGNTPLIKLDNLEQYIKQNFNKTLELYAKFEGLNPTGSFKDRGMTLAVTKAYNKGAKAIVCASTGNTSASAAAYAAKAGIRAFVVIPEGKIAFGKMAQALMYGAIILQIKGNFDTGMQMVKDIADKAPVTIVNSINPYRIQGQKTASFEIIEQLGDSPDYHYLPVGNAGNITAHWIGYNESFGTDSEACSYCKGRCKFLKSKLSPSGKKPIMVGYQAVGAAPFTAGVIVRNPETIATAIRIGNPQSWQQAWAVIKESNGWFDKVTDEKILEAHKLLAVREGIFCEPSSATSFAGILNDLKKHKINDYSKIVLTLTGNGLKDSDAAVMQSKNTKVIQIESNVDELSKHILDELD